MAGGLVHIGIGLLSAILVHLRHFKLEYSLAVFVGNLLPDALKFGLTALKQGTLNVFHVEQDATYTLFRSISDHPQNWFSLGFFILSLSWLLFHYHIIRKKRMMEYDELYVFLLIGVLTHLILDALITEQGIWW